MSDENGGVIVGATVTATDANGKAKNATTNGEGAFSLAGLAPGKYTVRVSAPGFGTFENTEVPVTTRAEQLDVGAGAARLPRPAVVLGQVPPRERPVAQAAL